MADGVVDTKLRQVLDYWSCETCLDTYSPEQDYLCGICARLNREVVVKRTALAGDEAVQVIPPEDFTMAKDLRDRIQQQELELEEARAQAQRLQSREQKLEDALKRLQADLEKARREKDESGLVPFTFVGIKDTMVPSERRQEEILEFEEETPPPPPPTEQEIAEPPAEPEIAEPEPPAEPEAPAEPEWEAAAPEPQPEPQWEAVEEAPAEEAQWEPAPEEPTEAPIEADEPAPEFQSTTTPRAETFTPDEPPRMITADDAIARIESEIGKIEQELSELSSREKDLKAKAKTKSKRKKR